MSGYITLLGAEDVTRAASTMTGAAQEMQRAAGSFDYSVTQQQRVLSDFLEQFERLVERLERATKDPTP